MSDDPACARAREVIPELAAGATAGDERAGALGHVSWCPTCRHDLRENAAVVDELLSLAPVYEPPAGFEVAVLARIGTEGSEPRGQWRRMRPPRRRDPVRQSARDGRPARRWPVLRGAADGPPRTRRPADPGERAWRRPAAVLVALIAVATLAGGGVWRATESDRTLAAGYRATLEAANGRYLTAGGIYAAGQRVGQVFGYQGAPSWLFLTIVNAPVSGVYDVAVVTIDGRRRAMGQVLIAAGRATWGSSVDHHVAEVARIVLTRPGAPEITGRFRQRTAW
ncbi:hypothetical protein C1I98_20590 [Spongiactinospora gelatinilytica]|uniref:Zinc-finger domain-containing protein n=1 Tax=Spongiactinospora gelatinilytica TaxID=2666298 RepID=A0A2W2H6M6_9ACTN|nr:hypothetical protein [Spongiactinospora gelatinilytica]PZG41857.1 hypothetical protein C1I98_20590 [Spongiactinospora gelatinilytica]